MNIQQNSQTLNVQFDDLGGNFLRKKFSMVVILQIYKFLPTRPRKTVYTKLNAINTTSLNIDTVYPAFCFAN